MPQYFFHIFNDDIVMDEEGQELADLEAAREVALDSARDLVCESVQHGHLNLDHRIEVEDDKGETLLVLTYRDAFTIQN